MCCVWTFAELVTEQEKQMPLEKYQIDESYYRRPLATRLVNYALCGYLFSSAVFGTVVGGLWATGYVEIWLP